MRANITILLFCVSFFLSFCTNLQPIFLGKTIWNKECPKSCSWEAPSLAQVGKFHKMLIACPWRPLVGFILSVFGMAFGLTRLTRVQPNSNSISQMSLINCSKPQLRCLQCETRGKKRNDPVLWSSQTLNFMYQSYSSCQCHEARVHHDIDGVHKRCMYQTTPSH